MSRLLLSDRLIFHDLLTVGLRLYVHPRRHFDGRLELYGFSYPARFGLCFFFLCLRLRRRTRPVVSEVFTTAVVSSVRVVAVVRSH